MLYEIRKVNHKNVAKKILGGQHEDTSEMLSTGLEKHMVDYLFVEKKWDREKSYVIGYANETYKKTGIIAAIAEYCGTCDIINVCVDPGYGYDHVLMFQLCFSDKQLGLCIFDTYTKQFIEEPDTYEEYSTTAEEVERKYNFK